MGLRDLRNRIHDTRSGDTTDPLGLHDEPATEPSVDERLDQTESGQDRIEMQVDQWFDMLTPDPDEDTDPGGADLASIDPNHEPAPGAHRSTQTKYGVGVSRCGVLGCGTNTTGLVCSVCLAAGRLPPDVDGYVAPYLERILPDPPRDWQYRAQMKVDSPRWPTERPEGIWLPLDGADDLPTLDGAGYVLEPLPDHPGWFVAGAEDDAADFEEARGRLRTEVIGRIGGAA